jgi:Complex 1 protein (LYR family)
LKYGKEIKLTDRDFFKKRIRKEFQSNRSVTNPEEIQFHIEASIIPFLVKKFDHNLCEHLLLNCKFSPNFAAS